jgi:hypothetical protein
MKQLVISLLLTVLVNSSVISQDLLGFESITGNDKKDFKLAEPKALEAAGYLLSVPIDGQKAERDKALKFMLMWMEGTPDYVFYIDENIGTFTHSSKALLSLYMACLTKNVLENAVPSNNRDELKLRSLELFMNYCMNPENHVEPYRQLEQLVKAREKGVLKRYIEQ